MPNEEALAYAEEHSIDAGAADPSAQLLAENPVVLEDEDAEGEVEVPVPEPQPTPKTPKAKTRKGKAAKEAEPESAKAVT